MDQCRKKRSEEYAQHHLMETLYMSLFTYFVYMSVYPRDNPHLSIYNWRPRVMELEDIGSSLGP